jgi:tetraacyldisaccharide 4'-kinase
MKQAPAFWEDINPISLLLWPFSILFSWIAKLRKLAYETNFLGFFKSQKLPVPVIIVGNIRVGGTGKTPIVITLAKELVKLGFRPGIISRGYVQSQEDQKQTNDGLEVVSNASPAIYGDEPVLMAKLLSSLNIPVFIGKKRYATGVALLKKYPTCDVIISDDGLQHYALARHPARIGGHDIEIVVRDARGEGSTFVLPAGPLREPADRPRDVTLQTGLDLQLTPTKYLGVPIYLIQVELGLAYRLNRPEETLPLQSFATKKVLAAAGLGHPQKFFDILSSSGLGADSGTEADSGGDMKTLPLPDHFSFESNPFEDPAFSDREAILITEKDAVKCQSFTDPRLWVVPLEAKLPEQFLQWIKTTIQKPAVQASSK